MTNSGQNALARKNGAILMAKSATWSLSINFNKASIPIVVTVYSFSVNVFFLKRFEIVPNHIQNVFIQN